MQGCCYDAPMKQETASDLEVQILQYWKLVTNIEIINIHEMTTPFIFNKRLTR